MTTKQKIGLIPVVLLCAAFFMIPMVAAAGNSPGTDAGNNQNPGGFIGSPSQSGSMNPGQATGQNGQMMPANGQSKNTGSDQTMGNTTAPNGQPGGNFSNRGNRTMTAPDGNRTLQMNGTYAGNLMFGHDNRDFNMTLQQNRTSLDNSTPSWHGHGNMTLQASLENSNSSGISARNGMDAALENRAGQQQAGNTSQSQLANQTDSDLISAFLNWLKGQ